MASTLGAHHPGQPHYHPTRPVVNIRHLRYLQLILSEGSFAAAASKAGVSQPAITQAMQTLEAQCGAPLFEKYGRSKRPTRMAQALARQSAQMQQQLDSVILDPTRAESAGAFDRVSLRVGMAPAAALLYATKIEALWHQHEPEGLLQIVSGSAPEMLASLRHGELDLVLGPRPRRYRADGLRHWPLHTSEPIVLARAGHPLLTATTLKEIGQARWAVSGRGGTPGNVIEEAHRVRRIPAPRIQVQCADYQTLLDLVAHSDLLCVVPHPILLQERHRAQLRALKIRDGLPQYEVCLFAKSQAAAEQTQAISALRQALTHEPAASRKARSPRQKA